MIKTPVKYRIHRTVAIIVVPLILISAITGFFRANKKWYWEDGYKKKKHVSHFFIEKDLFSIEALTKQIDSISHKKNELEEINIKPENDNLYYEIKTEAEDLYLAEAYTGKIISPLSKELASSFATQYVKGKPAIKNCELLSNYSSRKGKVVTPVYKIEFENEVHSQIFLDYYTGNIIEDIDDNRKFGIWMSRLHEYDFFNSKRGITSMVGISIMLLSLSGLWIYKIRLNKKKNSVQSESKI